ncbi:MULTISPECIES: helix-turn-helix domain-containing protein [unclassified Streptomyces]|uniref:helix-turn-helix domain-containing protein n=1 Tax=unclassified Streptomyces TaxID=2593676 RepID=UPI0009A0C5B4|nr:helix-turn-helix transcriptional regulator [Streptomyces sp. SAT1]
MTDQAPNQARVVPLRPQAARPAAARPATARALPGRPAAAHPAPGRPVPSRPAPGRPGADHPAPDRQVPGRPSAPAPAGRPEPAAAREPLWRDLVGDVLRRERLAQERTLKDVADAARISMPYLSEIERGRKEASSEVLAAAAQALGLGLGGLLARTQGELARLTSRAVGRGTSVRPVTSVTSVTSTSAVSAAPASRVDGLCLAA